MISRDNFEELSHFSVTRITLIKHPFDEEVTIIKHYTSPGIENSHQETSYLMREDDTFELVKFLVENEFLYIPPSAYRSHSRWIDNSIVLEYRRV